MENVGNSQDKHDNGANNIANNSTGPDDNKQVIDKPLDIRHIIAFGSMVVGMMMAILDIQIVASSISVIGAGLSASPEELAWIQTSYLMAEVVVIPMTNFFVRTFSTRITFSIAAAGFTLMSFFCSIAWSVDSMIIFRSLQGLFGGAMIPTVFATSFTIFNKDQRAVASVIIGLVASAAPTLGPTIGGYITENISWHFMFLINIIPGIIVTLIMITFGDFDKPNLELLKKLDYIGMFLLIITLGALQYTLEEGASKGWFESRVIIYLSFVIVIGFMLLMIRQLTYSYPILGFHAFINYNFSIGCMLSFIMGIGLYGAVYLMPLFLYRVAGMDTISIGSVMFVTGAFQILSAPIAGKVFKSNIDKRYMLAFGFIMFAIGCFLNSNLTAESRFYEMFIPQAVRGFALMFCFMPVNELALGTLTKKEIQNASSLYNLMRNLGGAIGLAIINTYIINSSKIQSSYISEHLTNTSVNTLNFLNMLTSILDGKILDVEKGAQIVVKSILEREAFLIAINNSFIAVGVCFLGILMLTPLIRKV